MHRGIERSECVQDVENGRAASLVGLHRNFLRRAGIVQHARLIRLDQHLGLHKIAVGRFHINLNLKPCLVQIRLGRLPDGLRLKNAALISIKQRQRHAETDADLVIRIRALGALDDGIRPHRDIGHAQRASKLLIRSPL